MKPIIILILIIIIICAVIGYVGLNRKYIFEQSVNAVIADLQSEHFKIGKFYIDAKKQQIIIEGLTVANPPEYEQPFMVKAPVVRFYFKAMTLQFDSVDVEDPVICIERLQNGQMNIHRAKEMIRGSVRRSALGLKSKFLLLVSYVLSPVKAVGSFENKSITFNIKAGKLIFDDKVVRPNVTTVIENINGMVGFDIGKYRNLTLVSSNGKGLISGFPGQELEWQSTYAPTTRLTMSNTLKLKNVDMVHFEPYYAKFSPFILEKARASGELIFNFDNGEIGSTNEILFHDLQIRQREQAQTQNFWEISAEDLYRYLTSGEDEIIFDFKIKGPMEKPKFYLGPKAKRALAMVAAQKITDMILEKTIKSQQPDIQKTLPEKEKSDIEKVIDIFKDIEKD